MKYNLAYGVASILIIILIAIGLKYMFNPTGAKILQYQPISYVIFVIIAIVVGSVTYLMYSKH